ncbi:zinc metallopeptidase [Anaerosacchariphilus polymeriproducens]|uniref:Peptidase n=1 Tax=Anaerosacchariphilus polymeriproducens TaxID=1812858 RepID=A0A371AXS0_9FIRM|nr:zinc metallopeptidase [Anaerosacchariphilus polymeriproducens]RDU24322.1 peptidase [Anaerosacchariphilus polymeriproducens]
MYNGIYSGYGMFWDPTYIFVIIGFVLCLGASALVKSAFHKYSRIRNRAGITGAEAAERILRSAGISDVEIVRVSGSLTDHYNPLTKKVALSDEVYDMASVAAVGIAAHECGHVIQHQKGFIPIKIRSAVAPVASIASRLYWIVFIIGFFINGKSGTMLINAGILMFLATLVFQVVTLPVELDASRRATIVLESAGILGDEEIVYTKKVLGAAALTYIAGVASSLLQLLRLLIIAGGRRSDD